MTDLSQLTDDQLMDLWTPGIFLPPTDMPKLRASVLNTNAAVERELAGRGIHREGDR